MNRAYSILNVKAIKDDQRIIIGTATTPEPDRLGDIIEPLGVRYKNPLPLLHQHNSLAPVGTVEFDKPTKNGITFTAEFSKIDEPPSLKERIDVAWAEVKTGLVRGISIGFRAIEKSFIDKNGGIRFTATEVIELSLVTVPANADCSITTIRSLDTAQRAASGQPTPQRVVSLNPPGASGPSQRKPEEGAKMKTLSEQIAALEAKRAASAARMDAVMQKSLDEDRTTQADEQEQFDTLAAEVEAIDRDLVRLRKLENTKAVAAKPVIKAETTDQGSLARGGLVPYAVPKQAGSQALVWNSLVCKLKAHITKQSPYQVLKDDYNDHEDTRAVMNVITRAATVPADTVTSGWASQLVDTSIQDFFTALMPMSVYPGLASRGGKFSFGRAGIVSMPTRASTPTIAGSFVPQGGAIPVRQGAFSAITFTPKKMAVISIFTRDIAEHSTPAIEGLIRQAIVEDTATAIDSVLLDATAATTTRPAGLRAGVTVTTATAAGGIAALIGDIRGLTSALITGSNGNLRSPVWIMNPGDVLAASLLPATAGGGEFPFKAELTGGTLQGYPVIQSANVTADMMLLVDAADFVSVTGDTPRFDVSDQATVHMEDTTPLAIGTVGSPNTVAAPVRSLWQTDCIGVRMLLDLNWGMRRTGTTAWTQTMTWN